MNHFRITDGHHTEGNVLGAHVIRTLDFVDFIGLGHDHAVVLQNHGIRIDTGLKFSKKKNLKDLSFLKFKFRTYHTLCITILASHCQIQAEGVRIDDINVTGLGTAQSIDTAIEGFVGAHLDSNAGILAVDGD